MAINSNMRPAEMFQLRLLNQMGARRQRRSPTLFSSLADALRTAGTAYASGQITQGAQDRREAANKEAMASLIGEIGGDRVAPSTNDLVSVIGNRDVNEETRKLASTLLAQQYSTGERVAGQDYGTGERVAGQGFRTGERVAGEGFRDEQRIAGEGFRTGERVAGEIFTREQNRKTLENRNTIAKLKIESRDANAKTRSENSQKIQQLKQYESDLKTPVKTETMTGRRLSEIQMELHGETDISLANMNSDFVVKRNKFDRITSITPVGADISPTGIVRSEVAQALQNVGGKPQGPVSDNAQRESTTTVDATGATGLADTPFRYLGQLNEMLTGSISEKSRAAQVVKRLVNKTTRTMVQNDNGKPSVWASKAIKDILPKVGAFITDRDYIDATNSVITELNRTIDRKLALSNNFSLRADVRSNASSDIVRLKELREDWRRTLPRGSEPNAAVNLEAVERARKKLEAD